MAHKIMKKTLAIILTVIMVFCVTQIAVFAGNNVTSNNSEEDPTFEIPKIVWPEINQTELPEIDWSDITWPELPDIVIGDADWQDNPNQSEESEIPTIPNEPDDEDDALFTPVPKKKQESEDEDQLPLIELPEEEVPLIDIPITEEPYCEIIEEDSPLADVPVTGDSMAIYTILSLIASTGLAYISFKE